MEATLAGVTFEYVLWGLIAFGALLIYLGIDAIVTAALAAPEKKARKDRKEPWKGIHRGPAWVTMLGSPLIIGVVALRVVWAIGAIAVTFRIVFAVVAGIITVVLAIIVLVLAIAAAIIGIIIVAIVAIIAFLAALAAIFLLALLMLSPFFGIRTLKNIFTKFHPLGGQIKKRSGK